MSSKLVKKLLQRAMTADAGSAVTTPASTHKNELSVNKRTGSPSTRQDTAVQDQISRILSLDAAVSRYASSTARKSFDRRSDDIKRECKRRRDATGGAKGVVTALSNSRGTASAIAQKPHERRYDKQTVKRQREEGYFEDLARALKKGRKGELKEKKVKKMKS